MQSLTPENINITLNRVKKSLTFYSLKSAKILSLAFDNFFSLSNEE